MRDPGPGPTPSGARVGGRPLLRPPLRRGRSPSDQGPGLLRPCALRQHGLEDPGAGPAPRMGGLAPPHGEALREVQKGSRFGHQRRRPMGVAPLHRGRALPAPPGKGAPGVRPSSQGHGRSPGPGGAPDGVAVASSPGGNVPLAGAPRRSGCPALRPASGGPGGGLCPRIHLCGGWG